MRTLRNIILNLKSFSLITMEIFPCVIIPKVCDGAKSIGGEEAIATLATL